MSLRSTRGRPWRSGLALIVACAALLAFAATSHATGFGPFCPASGSATITLGAGNGCTNSDLTLLTSVSYSNRVAPLHCAVAKATSDPNGASSNLWDAACGFGAFGDGTVLSGGPAGGRWGYARGKNDDTITLGGFFGTKAW